MYPKNIQALKSNMAANFQSFTPVGHFKT